MVRSVMRFLIAAAILASSAAALGNPAPAVYTLGAPLGQVSDIDVDYSGRLIVMDSARQAVLRFGIDGQLDRLWPYDDSLQTYDYPTHGGVAVRPDGKIYVSPGYDGKTPIRLLDLDSCTCEPIDDTTWWYAKLAVAPDDGFYAIVYPTGEGVKRPNYVQAFSAEGKPGKKWDGDKWWRGITVGGDGSAYVKTDDDKWTVFSPDGKQLRTLDLADVFAPGKWQSGGMIIDRDGSLYANGYAIGPRGFQDVIVRVGSDGKLLKQFQGPEQETWPRKRFGLAAVRNGLVYATVSLGNEDTDYQIWVFTAGGQCVAKYIGPQPEINLPGAIAVQSDGSCAVQQLGSRNVLLLDPDLKPYGKIAEPYSGNVLSGPDGGYYVVDGNSLALDRQAGQEGEGTDQGQPDSGREWPLEGLRLACRMRFQWPRLG